MPSSFSKDIPFSRYRFLCFLHLIWRRCRSLIACVSFFVSAPVWAQVTATGDVKPGALPNDAPSWSPGDLTVGDSALGKLEILEGGRVTVATEVILGAQNGGEGTVELSGSGAILESGSGDMYIGLEGIGILQVRDGAQVQGFNVVQIGGNHADIPPTIQGGTGSAVISGASTVFDAMHIVVGADGYGSLTVEAGAKITGDVGSSVRIGEDASGAGRIIVQGKDTSWSMYDTLMVGVAGKGSFAILDQAVVSSYGAALGNNAGGKGAAVVAGAGSQWQIDGLPLAIGLNGEGAVHISDQGYVSAPQVVLGEFAGSGSLRIDKKGVLETELLHTPVGGGNAAIALDGGILRAAANQGNFLQNFEAGEVVIEAGGAGIDTQAYNIGIQTDLRGTGDLVKLGSGTLTLSGQNVYGNTIVQEGTLEGSVAAIRGNLYNDGHTHFIQPVDATFDGTLTGSGTAQKSGAGVMTLSGISTLNWQVDEGGLVSAAERFTGNANIAAPATLTFAQTADATYAGILSGTGNFNKTGDGKLAITGDSGAFAGASFIQAGTLAVNGTLGGALTMANGSTLAGAGTVGTTTLQTGSTLSPGNSIGTITIDGDLTVQPGTRYLVELDPRSLNADLTRVTGTATLNGGTVAHIGQDGTYRTDAVYRILQANKLVGQFDGLVSLDYAFLDPRLLHDYNDQAVDIVFPRNGVSIPDKGRTPNQTETGKGIESLRPGDPVYDTIINLPNDERLIQDSLDRLSGEIHASMRTALLEDSRFIRLTTNERLRSSQYAMPAQHPGWAATYGAWGKTDNDGNAADLKYRNYGLLLGADTVLGEHGRAGLMAGYSYTRADVDDRYSSSKSDNYHLGAYTGGQWGRFSARAVLAYSWHDIRSHRAVQVASLSESLDGAYRGRTMQALGELAYRFDWDKTMLEPYANLVHVNLRTKGFTESGGDSALSVGSQSTPATYTTLGVRGEFDLGLKSMQSSRLRGLLGWRHAYGDTTPHTQNNFRGGQPFTIWGVPLARDAALVEMGLDMAPGKTTRVRVGYQGLLAAHGRDHGLHASLEVRF